MQLQRAEQIAPGIRILSTGDLQISLSERERLLLLENLYFYGQVYINELASFSQNAQFIAEVETVEEAYSKQSYKPTDTGLARLEYEILAPYSENGYFEVLQPEQVGGLTDATIIGIDPYDHDDYDGLGIREDAQIFWYPDYAIKSFVDELLINGETIFKGAD